MRARKKLSAKDVLNAKEPGRYGDGGGLELQVSKWKTKAWLFRYMRQGKTRWLGLGAYPDVSLSEARDAAGEQRKLLRNHVDPIDAKRERQMSTRLDAAKLTTFADVARDYIDQHRPGWKNEKHAAQWEATLLGESAATLAINDLPAGAIDTTLVLKVLRPIWNEKPETARRVRGRIETVLDAAKAAHLRDGENPARWKGHLSHLLTGRSKSKAVNHHAALAYTDMPAFMSELRSKNFISGRALEFTVLTASRTSETTGACWPEMDLKAKLWTVPTDRMKGGRQHIVPLSDRAVAILNELPHEASDKGFIFPGARKSKPLSNMAMLELLRGLRPGFTVHGFRSSFRDWSGDRSNFPREVIEAALAHAIQDESEAAYRRSTAIEKRRLLMSAWARYCEQKPINMQNVTAIREARV